MPLRAVGLYHVTHSGLFFHVLVTYQQRFTAWNGVKHPQAKAAMAVQSARETLNMAPLAVITVNSVAVESYAGRVSTQEINGQK